MQANRRAGVPITQSSASRMTSSTNVVPRSSPSMTSMASTAVPGSSGISRVRQSLSCLSCSLRASRSAPHSSSASFANSDGWIWTGPIVIQRSAPYALVPKTSTSSRLTIAASSSG